MPCYMTGSAGGDANLAYDEVSKEATKVTRLLCHFCKYQEKNNRKIPPRVLKWWESHKRQDES